MNSSDKDFQNALEDFAYLKEELRQSTILFENLPVFERPGDSLSIYEYISLLDVLQENEISKIIEELLSDESGVVTDDLNEGNLRLTTLDQAIGKMLSDREVLSADDSKSRDLSGIIFRIMDRRAELSAKISESIHDITDLQKKRLSQILRHQVNIERSVFKKIAEYLLAIEPRN